MRTPWINYVRFNTTRKSATCTNVTVLYRRIRYNVHLDHVRVRSWYNCWLFTFATASTEEVRVLIEQQVIWRQADRRIDGRWKQGHPSQSTANGPFFGSSSDQRGWVGKNRRPLKSEEYHHEEHRDRYQMEWMIFGLANWKAVTTQATAFSPRLREWYCEVQSDQTRLPLGLLG